MNFNMKRPCANCPWQKKGAIELAPGRREDIIDGLLQDDWKTFQCHKVVYSKNGGEWVETEDGEEVYRPSGRESACLGAIAYLSKLGRLPVAARLALMTGDLTLQQIEAAKAVTVDPAT